VENGNIAGKIGNFDKNRFDKMFLGA